MKLLSLLISCWIFWVSNTAEAVRCTTEGSLRLVGWTDAGRIEICHDREWGTICADSESIPWSEKNAQVACRALGYSGALNSILHNTMPESDQVDDPNYPIHYSQFRCTGEERSLQDCDKELGTGCSHQHDAAIVCRRNEMHGHVRLMGDTRNEVGAIELLHAQVGWTGICADSEHAPLWLNNTAAAQVVCRQLGYEGGRPYVERLSMSSIERRSVTIDGCNKDEDFNLMDCSTSVLTSNCSSDAVGWVECTLADGSYGNALKVGGDREGIVQVEFYGRRGHICDTSWGSVDAEVACVEFNKHNAVNGYDTNPEGNYSKYISDLMPIWLTEVRCTTTTTTDEDGNTETEVNEDDIIDCDISDDYPIGYTDCNALYRKDRIAEADCGTSLHPAAIAGIVLGVLSPYICCLVVFGIVSLCAYCRKSGNSCGDCGECIGDCCSSACETVTDCCSSACDTVTDCCSSGCDAVSHCTHRTRRFLRPRRIVAFRRAHMTVSTATTITTTSGSENGGAEVTAVSTTFEEPHTESQPEPEADLTKAAPPSYTEAISYATVGDADTKPPPPSYIEPLVLPAPEPVD